MYSFLGQDEDEHASLLDMFKSEKFSIPELHSIKENVESNQNNIKAPSPIKFSDEKIPSEEEKSLSKMELKRMQGKVRAKRSRDRK